MNKRKYLVCACGILLGIACANVSASSAQLYFNNASGLGNANAGEAAIADDASTVYNNPAGLTLIDHPQLVAGMVEGRFDGHFVGTDTYAIPGVVSIAQTGYTNGIPTYGPYPFVYYSHPINDAFTFGFGMLTPFGIGIQIPQASRVRYAGTRFLMYDIDLSPSIGWRITDALSFGLGLDLQYLEYYTRSMSPSFTGGPDAKTINDAHDWATGFHFGFLYKLNQKIRAGLTFHSQTVFHPNGRSEYVFTPGAYVGNEIVSNSYKFKTLVPATTTVSIYDDVTPQWAMMGTVGYSKWSALRQTIYQNIAAPTSTGGPSQVNGPTTQYYHDTWRVAVGTNYKVNPRWTVRLGTSFESDPTNDKYRPLTDPGSQAISLNVGVHYQALKTLGLDLGYQHSFISASSVNTVNGLNTEYGQVYMDRDALGGQLTWDIV